MLKENTLAQVKQLMFEVHVRNGVMIPGRVIENYKLYLEVIKGIRKQGFKSWSTHFNPACRFHSKFTGKYLSRCVEVSFVNMNFQHS